MAKKSSKKTALPETVWLYVPGAKDGDPDKIAPHEFSNEHATKLLNMANNGGWVIWEQSDKLSSNASTDRADKGNTQQANQGEESNS